MGGSSIGLVVSQDLWECLLFASRCKVALYQILVGDEPSATAHVTCNRGGNQRVEQAVSDRLDYVLDCDFGTNVE